MKKIAGVLMLLMAVVLLGWIGYNLFIETLPEAEGRNPIWALTFSAGLIYVGQKWVRAAPAKL